MKNTSLIELIEWHLNELYADYYAFRVALGWKSGKHFPGPDFDPEPDRKEFVGRMFDAFEKEARLKDTDYDTRNEIFGYHVFESIHSEPTTHIMPEPAGGDMGFLTKF